jgi:hypothetical protein
MFSRKCRHPAGHGYPGAGYPPCPQHVCHPSSPGVPNEVVSGVSGVDIAVCRRTPTGVAPRETLDPGVGSPFEHLIFQTFPSLLGFPLFVSEVDMAVDIGVAKEPGEVDCVSGKEPCLRRRSLGSLSCEDPWPVWGSLCKINKGLWKDVSGCLCDVRLHALAWELAPLGLTPLPPSPRLVPRPSSRLPLSHGGRQVLANYDSGRGLAGRPRGEARGRRPWHGGLSRMSSVQGAGWPSGATAATSGGGQGTAPLGLYRK